MVISTKDCFAQCPKRAINTDISDLRFLGLCIGLRTVSLGEHERIKRFSVNLQTRFLGNFQREVNGEAVGVVQYEGCVSRKGSLTTVFGLSDRDIQDGNSGIQRLQEGFFLSNCQSAHARKFIVNRWIGGRHRLLGSTKELGETCLVESQQAHRANASAQKTSEHVSAPVVGGDNTVGHQHQARADVVCDDTQANVILMVAAVFLAREFRRSIKNRAHLVNFIHIGDTLLEEGDALHPHAGIDVFLGQLPHDVKINFGTDVLDQILHEHEIPDLDVSGVIHRWSPLGTKRGTAVKIDFRAGPCRTRLAGGPIVILAPHALNALFGQARDAFP